MTKLVLDVEAITKEYKLGLMNAKTFKESITTYVNKFSERNDNKFIWALNGVSFKLNEGEVLGIIGHNGAGKSTLLKILSEITPPSSGSIKIKGQIASLLEVGTGFHNELTGRENIFMNGAILGMSKKNIKVVIDQIIDFSEIKRNLIDTPIKKYSSGMKVRLAFAVAVHLNANILLMDEVLAVSDYRFQEKSLKKLKELVANGKSIIFVSHDLESIRTICNKCILLKNGKVINEGSPNDVIKFYLEDSSTFTENEVGKVFNLGVIQFSNMSISPKDRVAASVDEGEGIRLNFKYAIDKKAFRKKGQLYLKIQCKSEDGILLFESEKNEVPLDDNLDGNITFYTSPLNLRGGTYQITLLVNYGNVNQKIERFAKLSIVNTDENSLLREGLLNISSSWKNSFSHQ